MLKLCFLTRKWKETIQFITEVCEQCLKVFSLELYLALQIFFTCGTKHKLPHLTCLNHSLTVLFVLVKASHMHIGLTKNSHNPTILKFTIQQITYLSIYHRLNSMCTINDYQLLLLLFKFEYS